MDAKQNRGCVLIVDDKLENIQVLGGILKKEGYQVNVAQSGQKALESVDAMTPDLILLDIMMPGLDGFETCKQLKAKSNAIDIPVIFLTAKTELDDIVQGFELGAVDYITKPFNLSELLARVNTHLDLKFTKDDLQKSKTELEESVYEQKKLLHVLCHDLRAPLGNILSTLGILEEEPDVFEMMKDRLKISVLNGIKTIDLVREMKELDQFAVSLSKVNLNEVIQESVTMMEYRGGQKNIDIDVYVDSSINVQAEKTSLINSVFNNLLSNAIKFSDPDSKVIVEISLEDNNAVISVKDYGIGIPPKMLSEIFDESKQTTRKGTAGELGTGFGLPLVNKYVTAYGGTIEVLSKDIKTNPDDHGTECKITLGVS